MKKLNHEGVKLPPPDKTTDLIVSLIYLVSALGVLAAMILIFLQATDGLWNN